MRRPALLAILFLFILSPMPAKAERLLRPVVERVEVSLETSELYVSGRNFGSEQRLEVALGGESLDLLSTSEQHLIAKLPANLVPGSYRLEVTRYKKKRSKSSWLSVTVFPVVDDPKPSLPSEITVLNGLIGINNPSPSAELDVSGEIIADELSGPWDKSQEGYIRIGEMQIVYGQYVSDSSTTTARTNLPAPFADDSYAIILTPRFPVRFANVISQDKDGFYAQSFAPDGFYSGADGWYMAIGVWRRE